MLIPPRPQKHRPAPNVLERLSDCTLVNAATRRNAENQRYVVAKLRLPDGKHRILASARQDMVDALGRLPPGTRIRSLKGWRDAEVLVPFEFVAERATPYHARLRARLGGWLHRIAARLSRHDGHTDPPFPHREMPPGRH